MSSAKKPRVARSVSPASAAAAPAPAPGGLIAPSSSPSSKLLAASSSSSPSPSPPPSLQLDHRDRDHHRRRRREASSSPTTSVSSESSMSSQSSSLFEEQAASSSSYDDSDHRHGQGHQVAASSSNEVALAQAQAEAPAPAAAATTLAKMKRARSTSRGRTTKSPESALPPPPSSSSSSLRVSFPSSSGDSAGIATKDNNSNSTQRSNSNSSSSSSSSGSRKRKAHDLAWPYVTATPPRNDGRDLSPRAAPASSEWSPSPSLSRSFTAPPRTAATVTRIKTEPRDYDVGADGIGGRVTGAGSGVEMPPNALPPQPNALPPKREAMQRSPSPHVSTSKSGKGKGSSHRETIVCPVCRRSLQGRGNFKVHMLEQHGNGKRGFACTRCHKVFARKYNLEVHMRTHADFRPFSCTYCSESFTQKSNLKRHVVTKHEKRYKCTECKGRFAGVPELSAHFAEAHPGMEFTYRKPRAEPAVTNKLLIAQKQQQHQQQQQQVDVHQAVSVEAAQKQLVASFAAAAAAQQQQQQQQQVSAAASASAAQQQQTTVADVKPRVQSGGSPQTRSFSPELLAAQRSFPLLQIQQPIPDAAVPAAATALAAALSPVSRTQSAHAKTDTLRRSLFSHSSVYARRHCPQLMTVGAANPISPQIITMGHRPSPPFTRAMSTPIMSSASHAGAAVAAGSSAAALATVAALGQSKSARAPHPLLSLARVATSMDSASTASGEATKGSVPQYHSYQLKYPMHAEILATAQLGSSALSVPSSPSVSAVATVPTAAPPPLSPGTSPAAAIATDVSTPTIDTNRISPPPPPKLEQPPERPPSPSSAAAAAAASKPPPSDPPPPRPASPASVDTGVSPTVINTMRAIGVDEATISKFLRTHAASSRTFPHQATPSPQISDINVHLRGAIQQLNIARHQFVSQSVPTSPQHRGHRYAATTSTHSTSHAHSTSSALSTPASSHHSSQPLPAALPPSHSIRPPPPPSSILSPPSVSPARPHTTVPAASMPDADTPPLNSANQGSRRESMSASPSSVDANDGNAKRPPSAMDLVRQANALRKMSDELLKAAAKSTGGGGGGGGESLSSDVMADSRSPSPPRSLLERIKGTECVWCGHEGCSGGRLF